MRQTRRCLSGVLTGVPAGLPTGRARGRTRGPLVLQPLPHSHACTGCAAVCVLAAALFLVGADALELSTGVLVLATLPLTLPPELVFDRFDFWPAVLVLLAVVAVLRNQRTLGLAALGVGAAAKLYPLVVVPLVILMRRGRAHVGGDLAVVAAAALAFVLPFALIAPRGLAHVAKVLVRRPLHIESLGGSILLTAHRLGIYKPTIYLSFAHSWDLAGPAGKGVAILGSLVEAGALVAVWVLSRVGPAGPASSCWRSPRPSLASSRSGRSSRPSTWCGSRQPFRSCWAASGGLP